MSFEFTPVAPGETIHAETINAIGTALANAATESHLWFKTTSGATLAIPFGTTNIGLDGYGPIDGQSLILSEPALDNTGGMVTLDFVALQTMWNLDWSAPAGIAGSQPPTALEIGDHLIFKWYPEQQRWTHIIEVAAPAFSATPPATSAFYTIADDAVVDVPDGITSVVLIAANAATNVNNVTINVADSTSTDVVTLDIISTMTLGFSDPPLGTTTLSPVGSYTGLMTVSGGMGAGASMQFKWIPPLAGWFHLSASLGALS